MQYIFRNFKTPSLKIIINMVKFYVTFVTNIFCKFPNISNSVSFIQNLFSLPRVWGKFLRSRFFSFKMKSFYCGRFFDINNPVCRYRKTFFSVQYVKFKETIKLIPSSEEDWVKETKYFFFFRCDFALERNYNSLYKMISYRRNLSIDVVGR